MQVGAVHERRQPIRDDDLFEQPPHHELQAGGYLIRVKVDRAQELGQEGRRPLDRAGEQLGKEGDVQHHAAGMALWWELAPVDVNQVGDAGEGKEGEAGWILPMNTW